MPFRISPNHACRFFVHIVRKNVPGVAYFHDGKRVVVVRYLPANSVIFSFYVPKNVSLENFFIYLLLTHETVILSPLGNVLA